MFKIFVTVSKDNIDSILYAKRIEVPSKPTEINGAFSIFWRAETQDKSKMVLCSYFSTFTFFKY